MTDFVWCVVDNDQSHCVSFFVQCGLLSIHCGLLCIADCHVLRRWRYCGGGGNLITRVAGVQALRGWKAL